MANEITGINSSKTQHSNDRNVQGAKKDTTGPRAEKSHAAATDKVSLTSTAARLKELEQRLANQPVVDTQRVRNVQSSISDGDYRVDSNRVADKMIAFESSLHK